MKKANLFLIPQADESSLRHLCDTICNCLSVEFATCVFEAVLPTANDTEVLAAYVCIAVDSSRPEKVKDIIKKQLWRARNGNNSTARMRDILAGTYRKTVAEFRLEDYGIFVPFRETKPASVRVHSFHHRPTFYRYRVAMEHLVNAPGPLQEYLEALFTSCPNHVFNQGGFRASSVREGQLGLHIPVEKVSSHEVLTLARASLGYEAVKSRHENLQKFLLERDTKTIACEVPLWVESWEFLEYHGVFKTYEDLTGHLDVLRCEDRDIMGVWDYKPNAAHERNAGIQVFLYALMLSLRTGLPMTRFICGYFDEQNAYIFRPSEVRFCSEQ